MWHRLDFLHLEMTMMEKNRIIQTDAIKLDNKRKWNNAIMSLGRKMAHYRAFFLHL